MAHTKANTAHDRPARLIRAMPQSKSIKEAMLTAGYAESTALHKPGETYNKAIETMKERAIDGDTEAQGLLAQVGISRETLWKRIRHIALDQNNNYNASIMVLAPLLREQGYNLQDTTKETAQTPINIGIIQTPQGTAIQAAQDNTPIADI